MIIIELMGLPGSGKTTMAPLIQDIVKMRGCSALLKNEAIFKVVRKMAVIGPLAGVLPKKFAHWVAKKGCRLLNRKKYEKIFIKSYPTFIQTLKNTVRVNSSDSLHQKKMMNWIIALGGYRELFVKHLEDQDAVIFCEGFANRVVNFYTSNVLMDPHTGINMALAGMPRNHMIIYVRASMDLCRERMISRGLTQRLIDSETGQIRKFYNQLLKGFDCASKVLSRQGIPLIEIDNNGGLENTKQQLIKRIGPYYEYFTSKPL